MKFKFNKKMVSTIVILIFGVAITVAALSAKNIALEDKTSSEIATEAVSATEMICPKELFPITLTVILLSPFWLAAKIWLAIRVRPKATVDDDNVLCFSCAVLTVSVLSRT